MATKYPKRILIETPDGGGEAIKDTAADAWHVATPTGDFRFYGSTPQMKVEVRHRMVADYPDTPSPVTFALS